MAEMTTKARSTLNDSGLKLIRKTLSPYPAASMVFEGLFGALTKWEHCIAMSVSGSLSSGRFDRYSDLDIALVCDESCSQQDLDHFIQMLLSDNGSVIVTYSGRHINDALLIYLIETNSWIIKVDIERVLLTAFSKSRDDIVVFSPNDFKIDIVAADVDESFNVTELLEKFIGWFWYSYAKIARGELLQGIASIDYSRKMVAVRLIRALSSARQLDYRRIEEEIDAVALNELYATHPIAVTRRACFAALNCQAEQVLLLAKQFQSEDEWTDFEGRLRLLQRIACQDANVHCED